MADKGLEIIVLTQQLELSGVIGRTIAALLLGLAEIEHTNIKERQKAESRQQSYVAFTPVALADQLKPIPRERVN